MQERALKPRAAKLFRTVWRLLAVLGVGLVLMSVLDVAPVVGGLKPYRWGFAIAGGVLLVGSAINLWRLRRSAQSGSEAL